MGNALAVPGKTKLGGLTGMLGSGSGSDSSGSGGGGGGSGATGAGGTF